MVLDRRPDHDGLRVSPALIGRRRQARQGGLDFSVRELLATLGGIEETVLLYPTGNKGRPRAQRILTDADLTQMRIDNS